MFFTTVNNRGNWYSQGLFLADDLLKSKYRNALTYYILERRNKSGFVWQKWHGCDS